MQGGTWLRGALAAIGLLAAAPAAAGAATITYTAGDHGTVVYTAAAGEQLNTTVGYEAGCLTGYDCVTFYGDSVATPVPTPCAQESGGAWSCVLDPDHSGVHVVGGSGADDVSILDADIGGFPAATPYAIAVDGGDGNDHLLGGSARDTLNGGAGADVVTGMGGGDAIDGGDGNDTLGGDSDDQHNNVSDGGSDVIHGGGGDDVLTGDASSTNAPVGHDVLDGGTGSDTVVNDWYRYDGNGNDEDPAPTVTLDGVANDGRPGEGDNVTAVENIKSGAPAGAIPATYVGDDGPNRIDLLFTNGVVRTAGGDDIITGSDYPDNLDGGAGNDHISGGFGDDIIIGGPGQDNIGGDRTAACEYGPIYGTCTIGSGNDTIYAQDGERDIVDCGPGADTAYVDAIDTTTGCETLQVSGSPSPPAPPPPPPPPVADPLPRMSVAHQRLTGASKHRWIAVTCRLAQAGRCTVRATISAKSASKLHLKVRRHARTFTLGSASRALAKAGTARLHIKLSRRTAQALRRPRSLRVTFRTAARYADGQTRSRTTHATLRR